MSSSRPATFEHWTSQWQRVYRPSDRPSGPAARDSQARRADRHYHRLSAPVARDAAGRRMRRPYHGGSIRNWLYGVSVAVSAMTVCPSVLSAQFAVYDPINYAENVLHYVHQLLQIKYQLQALAKLQLAPWRDVRGPLGEIESLMGQPRALGYAAPNVETTFDGLFPVSKLITDWPREQLTRAQSAVDVLKAALLSTARQEDAVAPGSQALQQMKDLNGSVQGHEQALELQNSAAVFNAEELMLLRQAAMAQTNIQAVYYANQLNAEAQRDETVRATLGQLATPPAPSADVSLRVSP